MTAVHERLRAALADRYRIEREIGAGGMATVYLAHDLKHDRSVALKVLHPELGAVIGAERFLQEIKTTARLQHPHILGLIDSGEANGLLFYVMPFVSGESLRSRLTREKQLPIAEALRIATEAASALDYAHRHGVVHRDIKPENVLLHDGQAMVADFGIALAVTVAGGGRMTQTGMSLGTPHYMSPEQALGEKEITPRADVYALGAMTYEMLTGDPPFTGSTAQAILAKVMTERPVPPSTTRDMVAPHIEAAVLTALAKLPADRWGTAKEFADALANPSLTAATAAVRRPSVKSRERIRPVVAAMGVMLLAAGIAAGWAAGRMPGRDAPDASPLTVTSILAPAGGNFGEQRSLALTPDGRRLAFVFAASDGSRMLWIRDLDRLDAIPIPRTTGATAPFWSPDGRSLGYFAGGYLTVLDPNGEPRRICQVANPTGGSWSSQGVILFGHRGGLSTATSSGNSCRIIISRDAGTMLRGVFLPDGKRFLYSRGRALEMAVGDLEGKQLATIPVKGAIDFAVVTPGYLIVPNRTDIRALDVQRINLRSFALEGPVVRLAPDVRSAGGVPTFAASTSGVIAWLPSVNDRPYLEYDAGGVLRDSVRIEGTWTLSVRPGRAGPPMVAVAGNSVGVWLYDLDSDRSTRLPVRDSSFSTAGMGQGTTWPVFSGDGSRLIHALMGPGHCWIVERDLRTDAERVVARDTASDPYQCPLPQDWSSDGRQLLLKRDSMLLIQGLDGSAETRRIVRPGAIWEGHFSPDGRWVAYSSDETGRPEVYIQKLASGQPIRVSQEGGRWPNWINAGRTVVFITPNGRVQDVDLGTDPASSAGTPRTLFTVQTWRRTTFDDRGTGFAVVGDGEHYLVRASPTGLAVALTQQWPLLLRRADSTSGGAAPR